MLKLVEIREENHHTISSKTSPAVNVSPSFIFHEAIPPSVIVGLMAGMLKRESAHLRADRWKPGRETGQNQHGIVHGYIRRAKTRATEADMAREVGRAAKSLAFLHWVLTGTVQAKYTQISDVTASR